MAYQVYITRDTFAFCSDRYRKPNHYHIGEADEINFDYPVSTNRFKVESKQKHKELFQAMDSLFGTTKQKPIKPKKETVKQSPPPFKELIKFIPPEQPTPITIENFFVSSYGIFEEIFSIPDGFTKFFDSKKSSYYTNSDNTMLVRVSDHWGWKIRFCGWHLAGYPKIVSFGWKKQFGKENKIGLIKISDLQPHVN